MKGWLAKYGEGNIGLALGQKLPDGHQLAALDVDDEALVDPVLNALPKPAPLKKGKKGVTAFVLIDALTTNRKFKRVENGKPAAKPSVELLAHGSQTVMPPSIHPDGPVYTWVFGEKMPVSDWPVVSDSVLDEITALCGGKGAHFEALNSMVWLGVGGGGNTHDVCVAATANMVSRGWNPMDIRDRIIRAKRDACARAGQSLDWPSADKTIEEWISSAQSKGMEGTAKPKKLPPERIMADWALALMGGPDHVATVNGQLRRYEDGHWPLVDIPALLKRMYQFDEGLREREAKAAVSILHTITEVHRFGHTPELEPRDDPKRQRICLTNGTLNLRTGDLELWNPEHELLHQLNFGWDDEAECPIYDRVAAQTLAHSGESIALWDEFCALTLVDDSSFQRILFLKGPGGNGKGTLARVLRNLHSPSAVGSVAITDLNDERKRTSLVGKLVNISGEQSRLNTVADTYLKKITGGDPVDIRRLYGETQNNVVMCVRFIELVNEMPATIDASDALRRRLIILECPNRVLEPDMDLDRKLLIERPGILRRLTTALRRLYARGHFQVPESSRIEVDAYMLENDAVAYWVSDRVDATDKEGTGSRELYSDFTDWYDAMGYKAPIPEAIWGRKLTALGYPAVNQRQGRAIVRMRRLTLRYAGRM